MKPIVITIKPALSKLCSLFIFLTITACSEVETDQEVDFSGWERAYMMYSSPFDGQQNVSTKSNVLLMFTHEINDDDLHSHIKLLDKDKNQVSITVNRQPGSELGLSITPDEPLLAGETYSVAYSGVTTNIGEVVNTQEIRFSTAGVTIGASSNDSSSHNPNDPFSFHVVREYPDSELPFMDFSVIRLTFNQPIDASSVKIDDGFKFTLPGQSETVSGKLLVKDRYIIFDPEVDLTPGVEYTLSLASSIKSRSGIALSVGEYSAKPYLPNNSQPRSTLVQKIYGEAGENLSPLSGMERNTVPVQSTSMGNIISYADADFHTELAFIPNFPDAVPFVIRSGSVVKGSRIPIDIGGEIPTGYDTGDVYLTLITDATGYLVPNKNSPDAPKQVQLVLDVAMTAQHIQANSSLSQDVLHVDLFGMGMSEDGILVVDVLGDIKPVILGSEKASGLVSFFLEAYPDQHNVPYKKTDTTPPELQSWLPNHKIDRVDPADAIVLVFSEPLQSDNLNEQITLTRNGNEDVSVIVTNDGGSVIIKPESPLKYNSSYIVNIGSEIKDISNNKISAPLIKTFTTLNYDSRDLAAPLVGGIYPGYGCKLIDSDFENGIAGRCEGGLINDDKFKIFELPSNRHIQITFNKLMNTSTYTLGENCNEGSIRVEEINVFGECLSTVKGNIYHDGSRLKFEPSMPYQSDNLYRMTLNSAQTSLCDGLDSVICSSENLPLRTNPLTLSVDNRHLGSGPLTIPFKMVGPENNKVFNALNQLPSADVNRNFFFDSTEQVVMDNAAKLSITDVGGLINSATLGCSSGSCPDQKNIYVTGYLPVDVGLFDEVSGRVPVDIHSQVFMTTSVTIYAKTLLGTSEFPTGPLIMRVRNQFDEAGNESPSVGYILWDEEKQQAMFQASLDVYFDAPGLKPEILGSELETNLHSYPLTVDLYGPVRLLTDGRMGIKLNNMNQLDFDVEVGASSNVDIKINKNDFSISLISQMIKGKLP